MTISLLIDRPVSVLAAGYTSWRVVMEHPFPVALWAALIMELTLLGMASLMLGLVVILAVLGHAYLDLLSRDA